MNYFKNEKQKTNFIFSVQMPYRVLKYSRIHRINYYQCIYAYNLTRVCWVLGLGWVRQPKPNLTQNFRLTQKPNPKIWVNPKTQPKPDPKPNILKPYIHFKYALSVPVHSYMIYECQECHAYMCINFASRTNIKLIFDLKYSLLNCSIKQFVSYLH